MVMVHETIHIRPPLRKQALTTCTIIQQMIKIAMRICAEATKVGWMSASARAIILAITTFETRQLAPAYKYVNRM